MVPVDLFKGKIKIVNGNKVVKSISFKFSTKEFSIEKITMNNFSSISFEECEKRELSANHREIIKQYQSLCSKEINKFSKELTKVLKSISGDDIKVEAEHAGTFICIASIFSGQLPANKDFFFNLGASPISLFPKSLVKKACAGHSVNVNLFHDKSSWMRCFKSLQKEPNYLKFGHSKNEVIDHRYAS